MRRFRQTVMRPDRICSMSLRPILAFSIIGMFAFPTAKAQRPAQVTPLPQGQVVLSKLSSPLYPPLARVARVSGDVEIALQIRQDGSVKSAYVVSGHPLLKAAALDSAQSSTFECHHCREVTPYSILYTFGFTTTQHCCQSQENSGSAGPPVGITQSQNHVTILSDPLCTCDPGADIIKVRSLKCMFLWHCSTRYGL